MSDARQIISVAILMVSAVVASRAVIPGKNRSKYFWYGILVLVPIIGLWIMDATGLLEYIDRSTFNGSVPIAYGLLFSGFAFGVQRIYPEISLFRALMVMFLTFIIWFFFAFAVLAHFW